MVFIYPEKHPVIVSEMVIKMSIIRGEVLHISERLKELAQNVSMLSGEEICMIEKIVSAFCNPSDPKCREILAKIQELRQHGCL